MQLIDGRETLYLMAEELPPVTNLKWYENASPEEMKKLVGRLYEIVLNQPEIAAVPLRRGKWKINSDGYYPYCSCCGKEPQGRAMTDYCPNCGAKMGKE